MNIQHLHNAILFALLFVFAALIAQAQYTIPKNVLGSGAVTSDNSNYKMIGTIGQTLIGVNKSSSNNSFIGFWYNKENITVGVEQLSNKIPDDFRLEQNYPNPFTQQTSIDLSPTLSRQERVITAGDRVRCSLKVYDVFGREVLDLSNKIIDNSSEGSFRHVTILNSQLSSPGVYYYRIVTPTFSQTKTMLFVK